MLLNFKESLLKRMLVKHSSHHTNPRNIKLVVGHGKGNYLLYVDNKIYMQRYYLTMVRGGTLNLDVVSADRRQGPPFEKPFNSFRKIMKKL